MNESNQNCSVIEHRQSRLIERVIGVIQEKPDDQRKLIGIAGPPASGKSTLMAEMVAALKTQFGASRVIGVPMDGFHLDNIQLDKDGSSSRKGAPHTFDVHGFVSLLKRITEEKDSIYAPEFDRSSDLSRNCAIKIDNSHDVVVVEGNYLLLEQTGWQAITDLLDLSISIDVPDDILQARLIQRWLDQGLSAEDAHRRAHSNDIPNATTVRSESTDADIIYRPENT